MRERGRGRSGRFAPLWALGTVALLALFFWNGTEQHYALGDDFYIARAFAGEVGGVAESYHYYIAAPLAWLLHGLTLQFPGIWWFSWLQLALLALGSYGVLLGLMRLAMRLHTPMWLGWLAGLLLIFGLTAEFSVAITYTTTAAVLALGALCLLGGAELAAPRGKIAWGVVGSAALICCAYMLRSLSAVPALAFWLALLGYRLLTNAAQEKALQFSLKPALCGALASALLGGAVVGIRAMENALLPAQAQANRAFVSARIAPMDYGGLDSVSAETMAELGWTDATVAMVRSWYFLDENMGTESFRKVEADMLKKEAAPLAQQLSDAKARLLQLFERTTNARDYWALCLWLCMAAFYAAAFRKQRNVWSLLAPIGCAGLGTLLLCCLAMMGRLPMRAAATVLLPACGMAVVLAWVEVSRSVLEMRGVLSCAVEVSADGGGVVRKPKFSLLRLIPALAALVLCIAVTANAAVSSFTYYYNPHHGDPNQCAYAGVDAYVLAHEDQLFIGDRTLGVDMRLFPDRSAGIPINLLPMWGGWNNHSEGYQAAFARYGLKHDAFHVTELLGDTVRLVTGMAGVSPELIDYLSECAGAEAVPVVEYEGNGFLIYRFALRETGKD